MASCPMSALDSVGVWSVVVLEGPPLCSRWGTLAAVHDNAFVSSLHAQLRHWVIQLLRLQLSVCMEEGGREGE